MKFAISFFFGVTVKVLKLDSAAPRGVSCSLARNPETACYLPCGNCVAQMSSLAHFARQLCAKPASLAGLCASTVNPRTFMRGGAVGCMGGYCEPSPCLAKKRRLLLSSYGMASCLSLFYCTSFCHGPELSDWIGSGVNEEAKGQFSHRATGPNTTLTIAVKNILTRQ